MADGGGLRVEFTDILYGVVIANGIYGLELGVSLGNYLLVFALVVIVDDWIDYRVGMRSAEATNRNYVVALVVDIVVLTVWYLLTTVRPAAFEWYLALLVVFSLLQGLWDATVLDSTWRELLGRPYLPTAVAFSGLLVAYDVWALPVWFVLTLAVAGFAALRLAHWRALLERPLGPP